VEERKDSVDKVILKRLRELRAEGAEGARIDTTLE